MPSTDSQTGPKLQQAVPEKEAPVQLYRAVLQSLNLFDEAEHFRHQQADKAAKHVQTVREQHMQWQAKSESAAPSCTAPSWLQATS